LIESVLSIQSLRENTVLPTRGFETLGVSRPVKVCAEALIKPLKICLKNGVGVWRVQRSGGVWEGRVMRLRPISHLSFVIKSFVITSFVITSFVITSFVMK
jgi:hypothetical protein